MGSEPWNPGRGSRTCDEVTVPLQQGAHQQEDVVRDETDKEDDDGAADQLSDPGLLLWLGPRTLPHSTKDT